MNFAILAAVGQRGARLNAIKLGRGSWGGGVEGRTADFITNFEIRGIAMRIYTDENNCGIKQYKAKFFNIQGDS